MDLTIKPRYPFYMYHKDFDEPVRMDNRAQEVEKANKGWSSAYIFKEYPKWVKGVMVNSAKEEDRLLNPREEKPETFGKPFITKVVKEDVRKKK